MTPSLEAYIIFCVILTLTPGADTILVLNSSLKSGLKGATITTVGICAGLLVHACLSALGLSLILKQSPQAFSVVKILGALYLGYLGLRSLYEALTTTVPVASLPESIQGSSAASASALVKPSGWKAAANFRQGLLSNVLNPKTALFYLTVLPQFVDSTAHVLLQSLVLASIHIGLSFVYLYLIARFVHGFSDWLSKKTVRQALEAASGIALLVFAVLLALSQRS